MVKPNPCAGLEFLQSPCPRRLGRLQAASFPFSSHNSWAPPVRTLGNATRKVTLSITKRSDCRHQRRRLEKNLFISSICQLIVSCNEENFGGSVPDFWWTLSESGFTGFADFQDCRRPIDSQRNDTIIWDAPISGGLSQIFGGRCLNQDLQDLRIFRIAGDRSILVQRILFALVERAVRRGTTIWDTPISGGASQIICS